MNYKSISILLACVLVLFLIIAATNVAQPPQPKSTTVFTGYRTELRDFVIQKTKEGYQTTHLSMTSSGDGVVIMSKY